MSRERIQKVLASAGFGPRRACEDLVLAGRVRVNGERVNRLPVLVDPQADAISVDGKRVRVERLVYFMLNKPKRVYCTQHDPAGRTRAVDLLVGVKERVFPVGRLDADSMGLLILTNDGDLAQTLTHPSFSVAKTYRAEVTGSPTAETIERLRGGVWLAGGRTSRATVRLIYRQRDKAILEITLKEGRNRQVRRMLSKAGHKVRRLTRIQIGKLSVARLPLGGWRPLTDSEVSYLRGLARRSESSPTDEAAPSKTLRDRTRPALDRHRRPKRRSNAIVRSGNRAASEARVSSKSERSEKDGGVEQPPRKRRRMIFPDQS